MTHYRKYFKQLQEDKQPVVWIQIVLFGFIKNLASHLERSPLIHSYCYASAGDHPTCLARYSYKSKSFMQYAG